jgi:hypothetical protein
MSVGLTFVRRGQTRALERRRADGSAGCRSLDANDGAVLLLARATRREARNPRLECVEFGTGFASGAGENGGLMGDNPPLEYDAVVFSRAPVRRSSCQHEAERRHRAGTRHSQRGRIVNGDSARQKVPERWKSTRRSKAFKPSCPDARAAVSSASVEDWAGALELTNTETGDRRVAIRRCLLPSSRPTKKAIYSHQMRRRGIRAWPGVQARPP